MCQLYFLLPTIQLVVLTVFFYIDSVAEVLGIVLSSWADPLTILSPMLYYYDNARAESVSEKLWQVENKGSDPASELLLALNSAQAKSLSYLRVTTSEGKGKSKSQAIVLRVLPAEAQSPANVTFYSVQLPKSLNKGETVALDIYSAFTHLLTPYPVEIGQSDVQLVLFHDSAHFLSPYPVKVQATAMKVPSFRVESFTKVEPSKISDGEIRYGPYENVPALSYMPITAHFENNEPFAVVKELEREIEISHWGNIYITEKYHLTHAGARHKGGFSRYVVA